MPPHAEDRAPFILVVDDDEGVRELMTDVLADEGYEVVCATSPTQAFELIEARRPDLILLDLLMSGPGGEGFAQRYRQTPHATAPIIVVSGRPDVVQQAASIGAAGAISKPFDLGKLIETVRAALRHA